MSIQRGDPPRVLNLKCHCCILADASTYRYFVSHLFGARCFLHQRVISQAINMLLESALAFTVSVQTTLNSESAQFFIPDVSRVAKAFEAQVQFLFKVLHGARVQQSAPHLARLLLRLDYSGYYSRGTS